MAKINTLNYQTVASWNGSQDLFIVEQPDGTKVATPAMVKQFIEAGDFEATGEVKDGHGNILADMAKSADVDAALSGKQDTLTFDNAPTANSNNPVKSGGIKTYVDNAASPKLNKVSIQSGVGRFPETEVGVQTVSVSFPVNFANVPQVLVSWDDTPALASYFKYPIKIASITKSGFTIRAERLIAGADWYFRWIAVDNQ